MSCLEIQEAPGRQAVCVVQAGRPETGQAVCIQQPGESPLQRPETLSARQQEEPKSIILISIPQALCAEGIANRTSSSVLRS